MLRRMVGARPWKGPRIPFCRIVAWTHGHTAVYGAAVHNELNIRIRRYYCFNNCNFSTLVQLMFANYTQADDLNPFQAQYFKCHDIMQRSTTHVCRRDQLLNE